VDKSQPETQSSRFLGQVDENTRRSVYYMSLYHCSIEYGARVGRTIYAFNPQGLRARKHNHEQLHAFLAVLSRHLSSPERSRLTRTLQRACPYDLSSTVVTFLFF
jgi:hypothetical protein